MNNRGTFHKNTNAYLSIYHIIFSYEINLKTSEYQEYIA